MSLSGEDRDLGPMKRLAQGDDAALGELLDRHGPLVFGLARRISGDAQVAEEVLQDTFLKLSRDAGEYRSSGAGVVPWLLRIARNGAIDAVRKRKRERRAPVEPEAFDAFADERARVVLESVALGEFGREVRAALEELPAGQRQALDLAYFAGLTQTEIAAKLEIPLGTAKTWVRAGLIALRERLARFVETGRSV